MIGRVFTLLSILLLIDLVFLLGIKRLAILSFDQHWISRIRTIHYAITGAFLVFSLGFFLIQGDPRMDANIFRSYYIWTDTFLILYLPKFIMAIYILLNELLIVIFKKYKKPITTILVGLALVFAVGMILSFIDGMFNGVYRFKLREVEVVSDRLPQSFDGFRIVQISDVHLGSWKNKADVMKGLSLVEQAHPDLILLTGDLINVNYLEAIPYTEEFSRLKAPFGKFSTFGNHDVGDYTRLNKIDSREYNTKGLAEFYNSTGFKMMRNEHCFFYKGKDSIALLGVDNWSVNKFRRLGRLDLALKGLNNNIFEILMSHDPSHWQAEVTEKTTVDLMLAGHTHGMQLGFNTSWLKWSPISWRNPEWLGLYQQGQQYLYVNAGFGFLGFSGRVGIWPEVTVITLKRPKK